MKLILMLMVIGLVGCGANREYGGLLTEPGEVYDVAYVPSGHGSDVAVGFTSKGSTTITPVSITIPERYAVVFKCQHGKFVIDGERGESIYKRFNKGDLVTIQYCEVFEVTKERKSGKTVTVTNSVDLHFIDAVKRELESVTGPEPDWKKLRVDAKP
jgi:hypothetical protein